MIWWDDYRPLTYANKMNTIETTSDVNKEKLNNFTQLLHSIVGIKVYKFWSGVTENTTATQYSDIDLLVAVSDESKLESTKHQCVSLFQKAFWSNANVLNFDRNNNEIYLVSPDGECALHLHIYSSKTYTIMTQRKHDLLINTCDTYQDNKVIEAVQHLAIRTYRLMSKIESGRYQELVGVFSELRDTILIPLLGSKYMHMNITSPKFFDQQKLPKEIADLYIKCYPNPTKDSCLEAIRSCFMIIKNIINEDKSTSHMWAMVDNLNNKINGEWI